MRIGNTVINIANLTKDYGRGRGVFDVSIQVKQGECYGFLGPNGAGKSTTIRHLMGFCRPQEGSVQVMGKDSWDNAARLKKHIGYIPGEIALPSGVTGEVFLKMLCSMQGIRRQCATYEPLVERFELDIRKTTRSMSLGEKRKLAIIAAFLHDPEILIMDEPTSGLDPVMQQAFIDLIREQRNRGKTVFLSSHIFHEVDVLCDRIAIIKDGRIVSEFTSDELKYDQGVIYSLQFEDRESYEKFADYGFSTIADSSQRLKVKVSIGREEQERFIMAAAECHVRDFHQIPFSLEDYFLEFYRDKELQGR